MRSGHTRTPLHALCWRLASRLRQGDCGQRRVSAARQGDGGGAQQRQRPCDGRRGRPHLAAGTAPAAASNGRHHRPDWRHAGRDGRTCAGRRGDACGERRRRRRACHASCGAAGPAQRRRRGGCSISTAQIAFSAPVAALRRRCSCCSGGERASAASAPPGAGGLHQRPAQARPAADGAVWPAAVPLVPAGSAASEGASPLRGPLRCVLCLTPGAPDADIVLLTSMPARAPAAQRPRLRTKGAGGGAGRRGGKTLLADAASCASRSRGVPARR